MAVSVTLAEPAKVQSAFMFPLTTAVTLGGLASPVGAATVNAMLPSADLFPALSAARYFTVCAPAAVTSTAGAVGGAGSQL